MRTKFIYFVLVPLVVVATIVYVFIDSWVESGLEYAGEKVIGAKVEVDGLRLTLSPIGLTIARIQVANPRDPWKNLFETGKIQFALNSAQLLRSKFLIETMEVNGLILGTRRTTDGSLPGLAKRQPADTSGTPSASAPVDTASFVGQAQPALTAKQSKTPFFDIDKIRKSLNTDSLITAQNLQTFRYIDSLRKEIDRSSQVWQSTLASLDQSKSRLNEVEANVKKINVGEIKSLDAAKSALTTLESSYKTVAEVSATVKERRDALTDGINRLSSSVSKIDEMAKQDFQTVLSLARLPDVSMKGLSELVLGKDIFKKVNDYLYWIDFARTNVPKYIPKPSAEAQRRLEGQNIHFPEERSYPKLWIKKILISGGTDKSQNPDYFYASGEVRNITNDQHLTGQPLTVALRATRGGTTTLGIDASFDRRNDEPVDHYRAELRGARIEDLSTGRSDFVPSKITNAVADASITIDVPGSRFESNTSIGFHNVAVVFDRQPQNTVERLVRDVLEAVKSFTVGLRVWKHEGSLDIAFSTDLDDQIAARTRKVIGDELARVQNEIRNKLNARIAEKRQELEKLFGEKKEEALGKLRSYESQVSGQVALADAKKKELENRIEEEKKKQTEGVKKKAEETIKGLFKKN